MKMPEELERAFNDQVTMELESANAYLQMASWFSYENLEGMAAWMRAQTAEERGHAELFLDFVLDRGGRVVLGAVDAPAFEFTNPLEVFETALSQEEAVTRSIHDLYRLAEELGDLSSIPFLQGFITEQNEEEATVGAIVDRLRLADGQSSALLLLDSELAARTAG